MAEAWPGFAVAGTEGRTAVWEGTLVPLRRPHKVRVAYWAPYAIERFTAHSIQPRVQVLEPLLERHPGFEEGPIPHVYPSRKEPALPFLCLFDPEAGEWSVEDLIAETTVPWAVRWLLFYEGWLATGRWLGGGRHPAAAGAAAGGKRLAPV